VPFLQLFEALLGGNPLPVDQNFDVKKNFTLFDVEKLIKTSISTSDFHDGFVNEVLLLFNGSEN